MIYLSYEYPGKIGDRYKTVPDLLCFYSMAAIESGSVCLTPRSSFHEAEMNWQVSSGR